MYAQAGFGGRWTRLLNCFHPVGAFTPELSGLCREDASNARSNQN
jgi:hypothetical protein